MRNKEILKDIKQKIAESLPTFDPDETYDLKEAERLVKERCDDVLSSFDNITDSSVSVACNRNTEEMYVMIDSTVMPDLTTLRFTIKKNGEISYDN